jgi:hypothetical protein
MSIAQENTSMTLDAIITNVLLAMINAQNETDKAFTTAINELAQTDVTIKYKKKVHNKMVEQEIKGNALTLGIIPTMLTIQKGIIELKTALNITEPKLQKLTITKSQDKPYLFQAQTIDAKYQNTYNYKPEASSTIRIHIAPIPQNTQT